MTAFPRHEGDVVTPWLGEILLALRRRNVDVSVMAPAYAGSGDSSWHGIRVGRFRYAPGSWETLTHDETAPDRLRRRPWFALLLPGFAVGGLVAAWRIARDKPDVVHVHWPAPNGLFGAAARLFSRGRVRVVSSYYSAELRWIGHDIPVLVPFLKWTVGSADVVTANSTATAAVVKRFGDVEVRVVPAPAGIPARVLSGTPESAAGSRTRGGGNDPPEVLFVGRLVERKGVEVLVRAVARLAVNRRITLTVVGEGEWRDRITETVEEAGAAEFVTLAGRLPQDALLDAYRRADVFVLPAVFDSKGDTEGLGVVLIEALSMGLPVVGADVGGIPDIVVDGVTGWLFPAGDDAGLARVLAEVLDNRAEARKRVRAGVRRVRDRFSPGSVAAAYAACYDAAVARRADKSGESSRPGSRSTHVRGGGRSPVDSERIGRSHYEREGHYDSPHHQDFGSRFQRYRVRKVLELHRPGPEDRVLDLGCALGTMSFAVAGLVREVVGIDFSRSAILESRSRLRDSGLSNVTFELADVRGSGLDDDHFDVVIAADLFEHLYPDDSVATAEEAFRVLRPGGRIVVWTPCRSHFLEVLKNRDILLPRDLGHVDYKSLPRMKRILTDAGFSIDRAYFAESHLPFLNRLERLGQRVVPLLRRRIAVLGRKPLNPGPEKARKPAEPVAGESVAS